MSKLHSRRASAVGCAAGILGAILCLIPDALPDEPRVFAIVNARLVPVAGPPIDKGTVVMRDGIIEAVGAGVAVPGDARIIDGAGMTLYPGLIDALSDIALEEVRPTAPARPRGQSASPAQPPQQAPQSAVSADEKQGLTPYRDAADLLDPSGRKIEAARAAGITTTLIAPRGGIFQGRSCLVNLSGDEPGRMVVKTPVASHISFAAGGGFGRGYPSSLMGVIAFVKQTLLDAGRYEAAWRIYEGNPGAPRPDRNKALEFLQPVVTGNSAVVLPGDTPVEILRILELAEQFKLKLIVSGAGQAGPVAQQLRERNVPVLLSVKFPERDKDSDPEAREELRKLRSRVEAPATAATLARAGVRFAFQSGDAAPKDFLRNVGKAVEAGLDRDTALRALTLTPAEFFGVADRIGSIERGKAANLLLATGDIFNPATRVRLVFVDGEKFEIAEPEPAAGAPGENGAPVPGTAQW